MGLKIERGVKRGAVRGLLYGTEGIGKSTLAAQWPTPLILDTEDGTRQLDCARVRCHDWQTLQGALLDLTGDPQGFETVVIDSVDWAERLILEHMLKKSGKRSIEDYPFGKGYVMLAEHVGEVLATADRLIDRGVHVLFVGHSHVKRTTPPDMEEGWDRYELKLSRQVAPLFREWADLLLFANYRTRLVEGSNGRMRAKGGKERILYAERTAAFDAKNRFGLPAEMPMAIDSLAGIFSAPAPAVRVTASVDDLRDTIAAAISKAKTVAKLGEIGDKLEVRLSEGKISEDDYAEFMGALNARHQEIEPAKGTGVAR
jgi:hypothetical protein